MDNFETHLHDAAKAARKKRFLTSAQLSLGEMISKLKPIVEKQKDRVVMGKTEEATVQYDFEYLFPTSIDSWRGIYAELALNFVVCDYFDNKQIPMNVSDFLKMLEGCIGKEFTGYKGGEYEMGLDTPVWVANYGHNGNTAVVDILDEGYQVIIITAYMES